MESDTSAAEHPDPVDGGRVHFRPDGPVDPARLEPRRTRANPRLPGEHADTCRPRRNPGEPAWPGPRLHFPGAGQYRPVAGGGTELDRHACVRRPSRAPARHIRRRAVLVVMGADARLLRRPRPARDPVFAAHCHLWRPVSVRAVAQPQAPGSGLPACAATDPGAHWLLRRAQLRRPRRIPGACACQHWPRHDFFRFPAVRIDALRHRHRLCHPGHGARTHRAEIQGCRLYRPADRHRQPSRIHVAWCAIAGGRCPPRRAGGPVAVRPGSLQTAQRCLRSPDR
ncbi:hypothetical protein D3C72_1233010 [compost metagenome]